MSDRIAVIDHGQLMQVDVPEAIYNQPSNAFVADFIGESTMIPLTRTGNELFMGDTLVTHVSDTATTSDWSLVIRPERLMVNPDTADRDSMLILTGAVKESVYQGETALLLLVLDDGTEVSVRSSTGSASSRATPDPGTQVQLAILRRDIIVVPTGDSQS